MNKEGMLGVLTSPERLAIVETEVRMLREEFKLMDLKIDQLLAFKHKGTGAFWIASSLIGAIITGLIEWVKGTH